MMLIAQVYAGINYHNTNKIIELITQEQTWKVIIKFVFQPRSLVLLFKKVSRRLLVIIVCRCKKVKTKSLRDFR
mgnify:CR=1 FL=1